MASKTYRAASALKSGVVYGGSAIFSSVNAITPHLAGAVDIMVVQQPDGSFRSTPFYVRFGKYTSLRSKERVVQIVVNGQTADFSMVLGSYGQAYLAAETTEIVSDGNDDLDLAGISSPASGYSSGDEEDLSVPYLTAEKAAEIRVEIERMRLAQTSAPGQLDAVEAALDRAEATAQVVGGGRSRVQESLTIDRAELELETYSTVLNDAGVEGGNAMVNNEVLTRVVELESVVVTENGGRFEEDAIAVSERVELETFATCRSALEPSASGLQWELDGISESVASGASEDLEAGVGVGVRVVGGPGDGERVEVVVVLEGLRGGGLQAPLGQEQGSQKGPAQCPSNAVDNGLDGTSSLDSLMELPHSDTVRPTPFLAHPWGSTPSSNSPRTSLPTDTHISSTTATTPPSLPTTSHPTPSPPSTTYAPTLPTNSLTISTSQPPRPLTPPPTHAPPTSRSPPTSPTPTPPHPRSPHTTTADRAGAAADAALIAALEDPSDPTPTIIQPPPEFHQPVQNLSPLNEWTGPASEFTTPRESPLSSSTSSDSSDHETTPSASPRPPHPTHSPHAQPHPPPSSAPPIPTSAARPPLPTRPLTARSPSPSHSSPSPLPTSPRLSYPPPSPAIPIPSPPAPFHSRPTPSKDHPFLTSPTPASRELPLGTSPDPGCLADAETSANRPPLSSQRPPPDPSMGGLMALGLQGFEMSLCGSTLRKDMGPGEAQQVFEAYKVTPQQFKAEGIAIASSPELVCRIGGVLYPWSAAAPMVLGMLAFGGRWDELIREGAINQLAGEPPLGAGGRLSPRRTNRGWSLWPFGKWRSTAPSPPPPSASVASSPTAPTFLPPADYSEPPNPPAAAAAAFRRAQTAPAASPVEATVHASALPPTRTTVPGQYQRKKHTVVVKKSLNPTAEQLASLPLVEGQNTILYRINNTELRAYIYLYRWKTRLVISDVDGTITRSDLLGHVLPAIGYDWSHDGITRLYCDIAHNGYQIMFLSSRAIGQASITRDYLHALEQNGHRMPTGPVIISPHGLLPSLYREMILRRPHEFKIACLQDIRALFPPDWNPFYAGFGNRNTDVISYREVGVPVARIFTINPKGEIAKASSTMQSSTWSSLSAINDLVHEVFPPQDPQAGGNSQREEFNDLHYWRPVSWLSLDDDLLDAATSPPAPQDPPVATLPQANSAPN